MRLRRMPTSRHVIAPHSSYVPDRPDADFDLSRDLKARAGVVAGALFIGCVLTAFYVANGRYVGSGDCVPAMYLPIALARGDGPWLDRFEAFLAGPDGRLPGYCEKSRGYVVSRYPIGPGLILAPLVVPQVFIWDRIEPGWDATAESFRTMARRLAKNASALLASVSMVMLWLYLRSIFEIRSATVATFAAALGTGMWSTASQAPWQHGPAVFCLTAVMVILQFSSDDRRMGLLAGLFAAMIVVCRTVDLPISAAIGLFVVRRKPGMRSGFVASSGMVALLWSAWNVYFFDHMTGGYAEIEKMHGWAHGIQGSWSTPLTTGLAGTFASPSHGLLVYSPWVLSGLAGLFLLPKIADESTSRLATVLGLSLIPTTIILSKYGCWWAGHCFGARFWIDSTPIFALFAAACWRGLETSANKFRNAAMALLIGSIFWSAALQAVAVGSYPTTWHSSPTNADRDHGRLWDFRDNEVTRGMKEGLRPREWSGWF